MALIGATLLVATFSVGTGTAATSCDKFASPAGFDGGPGSESQPLRTAQRLVDSLLPGQVGCLRAGTYEGEVTLSKGGTDSDRVIIQSYPGERAKIVGRIAIAPGADHLTLSDLDLVGVNPQNLGSPLIEANDVTVESSDITNNQTADCVFVGSAEHAVERVTIARNRIHDCGERPNTNRHQGISVWNAADTTIARNVIYDNADRGIQLYPFAQRTSVIFNRIDGNGEGVLISGNAFGASNDNVVERNVVTNSTMRDNLETFWRDGAPVGTGNVFRDNCVFGGVRDNGDGGITPRIEGAVVEGGLVADPGYVDRDAKDFRFRPDSACARLIRQGSGPPPDPDPNLVFDEEFDGALLDPSTWHTCFWWSTITCTIGSNDELELYNPADVFVQGGVLRMRAQRRNLLGWDGNLYAYTSGMAMTGGRKYEKAPGFTFTYGYAEARVRMPKGKGLWPAFWMLPASYESRPEIDVLEARGSNTNRVNFNVHFDEAVTGGSYTDTGTDFSGGYHTFAVDWQPAALTFYVDGIERWRYTGAGIPSEPMYLVLNLAVGGVYDGSPDASTPFPSYFDVDYVRVWQQPVG